MIIIVIIGAVKVGDKFHIPRKHITSNQMRQEKLDNLTQIRATTIITICVHRPS